MSDKEMKILSNRWNMVSGSEDKETMNYLKEFLSQGQNNQLFIKFTKVTNLLILV